MATKSMECPKCDGSGFIAAFSGVLNGVCFRCAGLGKVAFRVTKQKPLAPLTEHAAKLIETIKTGDLSKMDYDQLNALRSHAHSPNPHCPDLLKIWRERGDPFFFAAQEERLAEFYANR